MSKTIFTLLFLILLFKLSFSQQDKILTDFKKYVENPREVVYVHLNKSTYIKGEMIGFKMYVFDKSSKELSKLTSNLYCLIQDDKGNVLKKKLIKIENGIASNIFEIDSLFTTGIYRFKAYTNWLKNFNEQNHFEQDFKVIDADNNESIPNKKNIKYEVDLQVLGEGGHIVYGVANTIGIIAKNKLGFGISNAKGSITTQDDDIVAEFKLNDVGLAKTLFIPDSKTSYYVNLDLNGEIVKKPIEKIKFYGIIINAINNKKGLSVALKANEKTKEQVQNKNFKVAVHNGADLFLFPVKFNEEGNSYINIPQENLFSGVNILTVFNEENKPILERLYFNKNINHKKIEKALGKTINDSIRLNLNIGDESYSKFSSLSLSILPKGTESYHHHHNILSQVYIQPYIKGNIENGNRYFKKNDTKTNYDLDLLMITQGWSSYDWGNIFSSKNKELRYEFEKGIDIVANVNDNKYGTYLVYPLENTNTKLFNVEKDDKKFNVKNSFPFENDLFRIGYLNTKRDNFIEKPSLYLQYYPSKFPLPPTNYNLLRESFSTNETITDNYPLFLQYLKDSKITELDEVVVEAKAKKTRLEALQQKAIRSKIDIMDDNMKLRNMRLDIYLQRLGWFTQFDYFSGNLTITNPRVNWGPPVPMVFLDDALLSEDFSVLTFLYTKDIDYIDYDLYGIGGGGVRGNAGYIKIYTSPEGKKASAPNGVVNYNIPLRFSEEKTFYTPKYKYYNTDFFKEFGTITWLPTLKVNDGKLNFNIPNTQTKNITLFVEGVIDNAFISQEIDIEIN